MSKKRKSIMQGKDTGTCYLCGLLHKDFSIKSVRQEHHVMGGTANRRLSEKYGLKVYLCLEHHLYGPEAVHKNAEVAERLHKEAQKVFEKTYPDLNFMEIFGKNYLTENEMVYARDKRFRMYVDKYCGHRGVTTEGVLRHDGNGEKGV